MKGDESVDTGARFEFLDQDGVHPSPTTTRWRRRADHRDGSGTLELTDQGGAGPTAVPEGDGGLLGRLVGPITPAKATNAVDVTIDTGADARRRWSWAPRS